MSTAGLFLFFKPYKTQRSERNVDENYLAFMMGLRTFLEWGANLVTGFLPYLAYARQDKHTAGEREPISVELMAELSIESGLDLKNHYQTKEGQPDVIGVAPDAGATSFMIPFCWAMKRHCAVTAKYPLEPEKTAITDSMGDFKDKKKQLFWMT